MSAFTRASTAMALVCVAVTATLLSYFHFVDAPAVSAPAQQVADHSPLMEGALPLQLKMADRFAYRRIFALQAQGHWREADKLIAGLENPVLLGKVQAQRYLHPEYHSNVAELMEWLQHYSALSEAVRVGQLAVRKGALIPEPAAYKPMSGVMASANADRKTILRFGSSLMKKHLGWSPLRQHITDLLKAERHTQALAVLGKARDVTPLQYDLLRWSIASSLYNHGSYQQAATLAAASADRSGREFPVLHWLAGIAAWHHQSHATAYHHFAAMAKAANELTLADSAAAAFWAHRAAKALGKETLALDYLQQATATGDTFYGLQAAQILARAETQAAADRPLEGVEVAALRRHYALDTLLALAEIGHIDDASAEWAHQLTRASAAAKPPLMVLAGRLQLAGNNAVLARVDPESYPRPAAFQAADAGTDPALLYAIIKQESGFKTKISSRRGATGAMQLMPGTAQYLMAQIGGNKGNLHHTATNIALGQAYLKLLENQPHIGDNLIYMLAAYNAGPTVLGKWLRERPAQEDPFLFIESIPYPETRNYVLQVLKNYWVYQSLLHQDSPAAMPQMLTGEWPRYAALEPRNLASLQ